MRKMKQLPLVRACEPLQGASRGQQRPSKAVIQRDNRISKWIKSLPRVGNGDSIVGRQLPQRPLPSITRPPTSHSDPPSSPAEPTPSEMEKAKSSTDDPEYRRALGRNGITIMESETALPDWISRLVKEILPSDDTHVTPASEEELHEWRNRAIEGTKECDINYAMSTSINSTMKAVGKPNLGEDSEQLQAVADVPSKNPNFRVSTPKPDFFIGYRERAFLESVEDYLCLLEKGDVRYPFLDIEFKGDGPNSSGTLWGATNQLLGGTATFLHRIERLKFQLEKNSLQESSKPIDLVVFGIATNGSEARLFVAFSDGKGSFTSSLIQGFLLYQDAGFKKLMSYIEAIMDWGNRQRHKAIVNALERLSEVKAKIIPFKTQTTLEVIVEIGDEEEAREDGNDDGDEDGDEEEQGEREGTGADAGASPQGLEAPPEKRGPGRPPKVKAKFFHNISKSFSAKRASVKPISTKRKPESGEGKRGPGRPRKKRKSM